MTFRLRFTNLSTYRKDYCEKKRFRSLAKKVSAASANFCKAFILRSGREPKMHLLVDPSFYSASISLAEANEFGATLIAASSSSVKHDSGSEILKTISK